jgi:hypothetical protein
MLEKNHDVRPFKASISYWPVCLGFGFVALLAHRPIGRMISAWRAYHNRPEAIAVRKLRAACAANNASAAYAALMAWRVARRASDGDDCPERFLGNEQQPLREQWRELSRYLLAPKSATSVWQGNQLWAAFSENRRAVNRTVRVSPSSVLPALNPSENFDHGKETAGADPTLEFSPFAKVMLDMDEAMSAVIEAARDDWKRTKKARAKRKKK